MHAAFAPALPAVLPLKASPPSTRRPSQPAMSLPSERALTRRAALLSAAALAGLSALPLAAGAYGKVDDYSRLPSKASPAPAPAAAPPKKQPDFTRTAGIAVADLVAGTGPSPSDGDFVIVDFVAYLKSGVVFDNTKQPGRKSLVFQIGGNKVIPGLETAIKGMAMGGRRIAIIPPELAYGERGVCFPDQGCLVPPGETIEYDITLNRVAVSPI